MLHGPVCLRQGTYYFLVILFLALLSRFPACTVLCSGYDSVDPTVTPWQPARLEWGSDLCALAFRDRGLQTRGHSRI